MANISLYFDGSLPIRVWRIRERIVWECEEGEMERWRGTTLSNAQSWRPQIEERVFEPERERLRQKESEIDNLYF